MTKVFGIYLTKSKHTFSCLNSYIQHTIKPYACSIVPIERFNESIRIYERQCISNLVQKIQCIHALHRRQWISKVN